MDKKKVINNYTAEGRAEIHKILETVNIAVLHYMMRNPILNRSIEYNDNRLSLYCASHGKCSITGKILEIGNIHCHHKIPYSISQLRQPDTDMSGSPYSHSRCKQRGYSALQKFAEPQCTANRQNQ